ncbi:MAG: hypothetical protein U0939_04840 [Pirellulales bacterium]
MNAPSPRLKTLLAWADQARAGATPAGLDGWRRSTPDAALRWEQVVAALDQFDAGRVSLDEPQAPIEQLAAYLEDRLTDAEALSFEQLCLRSWPDFCELISERRFTASCMSVAPRNGSDQHGSPSFDRLLALPPASPGIAAPPVIVPPPTPPAPSAPPAPALRPRPTQRRRAPSPVLWIAIGGAALALLLLLAAVWNSRGVVPTDGAAPQLTRDTSTPSEKHSTTAERPSAPASPSRLPPAPRLAPQPEEAIVESPGPRSGVVPKREQIASPTSPPPAPQPSAPPPPAPPSPPASPENIPSATLVAMRSELGAALVPGSSPGSWQVGRGSRSLDQPLTIVSLADSWTTCDIAGLGTLIFAGDSRATLSLAADHSLTVALEYGRVGVRDMAESTQVRFETAGERWTTRGRGDYSTFGVVNDGDAAAVYVAAGIIAVDDAHVPAGRTARVQGGATSIAAAVQAQAATLVSPFRGPPDDDRWLKPPDEKRKREWQAVHGALVDRLAAADDAADALRRLREDARDGRQHALLASWNLSVVDDRGTALWEMLGDRQKFVRAAATRELLSWPPRDARLRAFLQSVRTNSDDRTASLVLEWVARSHRATPLIRSQAIEMVDNLNHPQTPVRQLAGFLLEYYAQDGLRTARLRAPAFDPRDSAMKRQASQAQWRALALQLFATRAAGNAARP